MIFKPLADEYAPFYAGYIWQAPDVPINQLLEHAHTRELIDLRNIPIEKTHYRYAEGKWSGVL